ncbi:MAG: glutathione S-transferase, partial [Bacteriovoracia bacterium]
DYVNTELAKSEWLAGDFSGADIMMSFPIEAAVARGKEDWPALKKFVAAIKARPAYQRALARGGDYQIL